MTLGSPPLDLDFLARIIDAVADPIFVKENGRFVLLNDACCRFIGRPREVLLGRTDYDFFPKEQADVFRQKDELVLATGQPNENEESFTDSQGRTYQIVTKKTRLEDASGRRLIVGVIRDMTEKHALEQALLSARQEALEAAQAKAAFLANVSHEIRTPMNGIIGMTHLLLKTTLSEEQHELAEIIRTSGDHLLTIINDVLDFSKIEAGKLRLEPRDLNLRETVEQVVDLVAPRALEKDLELAVWVDPRIPSLVIGDPARLAEILLNILGNAVKFTQSGSVLLEVSLEALEPDGVRIDFRVTDSGVGIDHEDLSTLFSAFSQVESPVSRKYPGTGLGLAIARDLVEIMGGRIEVTSRSGVGSTFRFTIRMSAGPTETSAPRGARPLSTELLRRPAVVASGRAVERRTLGRILGGLGLEVIETSTAEEARQALTGRPAVLAILDASLAGVEDAHAALPFSVPTVVIVPLGASRAPMLERFGQDAVLLSRPLTESRVVFALSRSLVKR